MDRIEHAERAHPRLGRVKPAADEHGADGKRRRLIRRDAAVEPRASLREIRRARILEVGTDLEVARIFRGLAVDNPRVGG